MRLDHPWLTGLLGLGAHHLVRAWMSTLDFKAAYHDPTNDPAYPTCVRRGIYAFWHEYILCLTYLRPRCRLGILLSRHRDADVLDQYARHLGFDCVRGSSTRGGAVALMRLLEKSRAMHLAITPDGPLGPRRRMAVGPVYLASKLQVPLTLIGIGYDRPWRFPTWDRFAVPRPYSRCRCIVGADIHVPPDLTREGLEHYRLYVERWLNDLCDESEAWARSGRRKPGQSEVLPGPSGGLLHDVYPRAAVVRLSQRNPVAEPVALD